MRCAAIALTLIAAAGVAFAQPGDTAPAEPTDGSGSGSALTVEPSPPPAPPVPAPPPPVTPVRTETAPVKPDAATIAANQGFRFGSYGRVLAGTDLRGGKPLTANVVAHGPRIVEP